MVCKNLILGCQDSYPAAWCPRGREVRLDKTGVSRMRTQYLEWQFAVRFMFFSSLTRCTGLWEHKGLQTVTLNTPFNKMENNRWVWWQNQHSLNSSLLNIRHLCSAAALRQLYTFLFVTVGIATNSGLLKIQSVLSYFSFTIQHFWVLTTVLIDLKTS